VSRVNDDERRSARLIFARELDAGLINEGDLDRPEVRAAVRSRRVPPLAVRIAQRLAVRRGRMGYFDDCVERDLEGRRAVLGEEAAGEPRLLVRMDEFPHYLAVDDPQRYGTDRFRRFHDIMLEAGVPYLIAVVAPPAERPMDPEVTGDRPLEDHERELLIEARTQGTAFAVHGLTHRTRHRNPRMHSELLGLRTGQVEELLDRAHEGLAGLDLDLRTFVAPFNRFSAAQYDVLARRYDVVTGGDESVTFLGYQRTPRWRGDAVYLPSYAPVYEKSGPAAGAVEELARRRAALWIPVTLHWGWEADSDDYATLRDAARILARYAAPWQDFLDELGGSRQALQGAT
jgi:hypothetical protein